MATLVVPAPRHAGVGITKPVVASVQSFIQRAGRTVTGVLPGHGARARIRELEERNRRLRSELITAKQAVQENRELRRKLNIPSLPDWQPLTARVIARDPYSWNLRFRINRGSEHGIVRGNAVLGKGRRVLGRITSLTKRTSIVTTLASPECRLSVSVDQNDSAGLLRGRKRVRWQQPALCVLNYLPKDAALQPGNLVRTSGLSPETPGGLLVGRISRRDAASDQVKRVVNQAYAQYIVDPVADLHHFRFVVVVTRSRE